ncbi:hypothetical protein BDZ89DRAFT_1046281 [Hymenopellis radicata]|nr:hypothetical protein BDZ89DRAFT_1046281 [Hymenopellis radicata]
MVSAGNPHPRHGTGNITHFTAGMPGSGSSLPQSGGSMSPDSVGSAINDGLRTTDGGISHLGSCSCPLSNNAKKQTPWTVANNDDDFTDWALHSGVWLEPEENPIIQQALATVKSMTELVLPAEWRRVPNPPIPFEKFQAAPFRKAVVDAAREANLLQESDNDDSDNDDSRAIRGSFNTLLALWRDVETSKRKQETSGKATYRRNLDALVADVFEFPYKDAHDDKKCEFNEFEVCLEEHLFLQENPASTTEIHPDTIVTSPPIFAYEIYQALKRKRPPSSAAPRTTSDAYLLFSLYSNVHFQKSVTLDTHDLRIIARGSQKFKKNTLKVGKMKKLSGSE